MICVSDQFPHRRSHQEGTGGPWSSCSEDEPLGRGLRDGLHDRVLDATVNGPDEVPRPTGTDSCTARNAIRVLCRETSEESSDGLPSGR